MNTTTTAETVRVDVCGQVREYRANIAGLGDYLAGGGRVVSLSTANAEARQLLRPTNRDGIAGAVVGASYWVELDSSGLAYEVELTGYPRVRHAILAAAPAPGTVVQEVYKA